MNPQISSLQKAEREIVINYPLNEVKKAIMFVFEKFPSKYILRKNDINNVFNTYHFPISNNLNPAIADMTLTEEGDKTKIQITITNAYGSLSSTSILFGILNDYLLVLGKVLNKESMEDIAQTVENSGCMGLLFVGFVLASLLFVLVSSLYAILA